MGVAKGSACRADKSFANSDQLLLMEQSASDRAKLHLLVGAGRSEKNWMQNHK